MHRETHVLHRQLRGSYPLAVAAGGCFIEDAEGRRYLDASGGAAVSCLGHGHPDVLAAMRAQMDRIAYAHTSFFSTEVAEQLADVLVADAPPGISHVYLVSGGSEAMEAALKLARQYFVEIGQPQRARFIARRNSYHGNTLGALAVGGNAWRRQQFAPLLIDVDHVAPTYAYRDRRANETEAQYCARLVAEVEQAFAKIGGDRVIAFVAETVGGATSGCLTAPAGYYKAVREICDRHGALLILDEVMCGMGRTGSLHACTQEGVSPDLMAIAKGLGGGYQPVGAVLAAGRVIDAIAQGSCSNAIGSSSAARPRARNSRRGCGRRSPGIRMSVTSAGADSSARSSSSPTAARRRRSIRGVRSRRGSAPRRWPPGCCATRWGAPSTAGSATTCCWRRRSSSRTTSSTSSSIGCGWRSTAPSPRDRLRPVRQRVARAGG